LTDGLRVLRSKYDRQMRATPELLASIVAEIAEASGLPASAIVLVENDSGSFSISMPGVTHSGTLEEVRDWAMSRARAIAAARAAAKAVDPALKQIRRGPR
jgi:hypothetical protein